MARQTFVWTALPHGIGSDQLLRLAVFLSPRLSDVLPGAQLTAFPLWSSWPLLVRDILPRLELLVRYRRAGESLRTLGQLRPVSPLAQDLWPAGWTALFGAAHVQPFAVTTIADRDVRSFPADALNQDIKRQFNQASAVSVAQQDLERRGFVHEATSIAPPDDQTVSAPMQEFLAFHEQTVPADETTRATPPEPPTDPAEFHSMLAWIGSYPELLPRLGLVFELMAPMADLEIHDGEIEIQAQPVFAGQPWPPLCATGETCDVIVEHHALFTITDARSFWPNAGDPAEPDPASVPCGELFSGGLLCPAVGSIAGRMLVSQIDFEGAALKLNSFPGASSAGEGTTASLPALRNAGFSLIRSGQADIARTLARQAETNESALAAEPPVLWAQNINRGYRMDVFEERTGQWRSLHERIVAAGPVDAPPELNLRGEGFTQIAMTAQNAPHGDSGAMPGALLAETLARWTGWSLTVPRPMAAADPLLGGGATPPADPVPLAISQEVPDASLPRLRYGHVYQFRLRAVDLAGNGPSLDEATATMTPFHLVPAQPWASLPGRPNHHRYLRFEPIASPAIVPRSRLLSSDAPPDRGSGVDRIVIRSNGSIVPVLQYAEQFPERALENQVHLAPSRVAPATAEAHGMFDAAFDSGSVEACDSAFDLCLQQADLPDFEPLPELTLPYLPDPLARGVALRVLGEPVALVGSAGEHLTLCQFRAEPEWPHLLPFRLEVQEASAYREPSYNSADRLVTVGLPPGQQVKLAVSSSFWLADQEAFARDLNSLGIWSWLNDLRLRVKAGVASDGISPGSEIGRALTSMSDSNSWPEQGAGQGRFWFLTPPRELVLVHALQQPLVAPSFRLSFDARIPDQTFVDLDNEIDIHPESTSRLDLTAAWQEVIDSQPGPPRWLPLAASPKDQRRLDVRSSLREQQVLEPRDQGEHPYLWAEDVPNLWWRRKSMLSLRANGAIEGPNTPQATAVAASGARLQGDVSASPLRHEFGDTKFRQVTYRLRASSRFQNDFPPPAGVDRAEWSTRDAVPITIDIPSSARPLPPVIRAVLPSFRRKTDKQLGQLTCEKFGGVRVYLARPWFTTGDEERLAVVLWGGEVWPLPPGHRATAFSTRWGRDPIWSQGAGAERQPLASRPALDHFPLRLPFESPEALFRVPTSAEPNRLFQVAVHSVRFNAERDLWFSDIQIDPGDAYFPFVQLALARFQAHSIDDHHLSEVVRAEFIQVFPHRRVDTLLLPGDPQILDITISGASVATSIGPGGIVTPSHRLTVRGERRVRGSDDAAWLPAVLPGPIEVDAQETETTLFWRGRVPLPRLHPADEMRVLVLEEEFLASDGQSPGEFVLTPRLIYSESINLDEVLNT